MGREAVHPSIGLLIEQHGGGDPGEIIRREARNLVAMAKAVGWQGPPFDPEMLASIRNIRVERVPPSQVREAVLLPDTSAGNFVVKINGEQPEERLRFGLLHEVSHTFFPDCASAVRHRGHQQHDAAFEALCDAGASELLFPLDDFVADVHDLGGPTFDALRVLRERYHASWEATGSRLVGTSSVTCAMVVLARRHKPAEVNAGPYLPGMEPQRRLRVEYSVRAGAWEATFVPKHKSIPDDSVLYELLDTLVVEGSPDDAVVGEEDWDELGLGEVTIRAMRLATDGPAKVLAWLLPA